MARAKLSTVAGIARPGVTGGQTQRFIVPSSVSAPPMPGLPPPVSAASIAKKALELNDVKGFEAIVKSMNIKISSEEAQVRGINALAHLAATGNQVQIQR